MRTSHASSASKYAREKVAFAGGLCTISGQDTIVLNKLHVPEVHITILAESLKDMPLDSLEINPAIMKALEDAWDAQKAMVAEDVEAT